MVEAGAHTPWPQPSPWPGMPPAVLGIDPAEYQEYMSTIVHRYFETLKSSWNESLHFAVHNHGVSVPGDEALADMVWRTPFSTFLSRGLDPKDQTHFAALIAEHPGAEWLKIDHAFLRHYKPLPGVTVHPSVGLFRRAPGGIALVGIELGGRVYAPGDGGRWDRAKAFFLQGCSIHLPMSCHPTVHFPMDSVVAVSRQVFGAAHPLRKLIEPHCYLQLPLNYGVLYNSRSVAHNHQQEIYTPLPAYRDSAFEGFIEHYTGIDGNSAYPGYRYPMQAPGFPGAFCEHLTAYYEVVLKLCRAVAGTLPQDDPAVARWGEALHALLPGFPAPEALRDSEVLARALAGFIHTVTVWHSADHFGFGALSIREIPMRLRIEGPEDDTPPEQWVSTTDIFRHHLAREMFFKDNTIRALTDIHYDFDIPEHIAAAEVFSSDLARVDAAAEPGQIPLSHIACSIQF